MINKDVCKSLACKNVNEILIWSWYNSLQHPVHYFPSHQQLINLNNRRKLQYLRNKALVFKSLLNNQATVRSFYVVIETTVYLLLRAHANIIGEI